MLIFNARTARVTVVALTRHLLIVWNTLTSYKICVAVNKKQAKCDERHSLHFNHQDASENQPDSLSL
ncbi:hypothetical protein A8L45_04065 [Veronia pacifica]|uniref:Uncharacterized protein n=1 Tax=Veronia pacifica TaxID=1080227 RepID=A0A1C3EQ25_9GAMM|nr:hypothetical protein A8L45_04065 [Veronia pacifica]